MNYYTLPATPALADYVRYFWVLESSPGHAAYIHRTMADGCAELIFHYQGTFDALLGDELREASFSAGMHGPARHFSRFETKGSFGIFGAYLYPFALARLFDVPAAALSGQMPDLATLLGQSGADLEEQMMLARDNTSRLNIICRFLESRLAASKEGRAPAIESAIRRVIHSGGNIRIGQLAGQYFYSSRQFERNFREQAGFTPKLFARIIRFQSAISCFGESGFSLGELAYRCGYYDQSHFISDFREFSGHHPGHYFSGLAEGTEWRGIS